MLSDRCPVLSVTLVYWGQTVRWIKMKLGVRVGLGHGHIVLDGDPAPPPQRGIAPQFSAHICCGQMAGWMKTPLGTEAGLGPGEFVLDGDPASPSPNRERSPPICGPCPAEWIKMVLGMEIGLSPGNLGLDVMDL